MIKQLREYDWIITALQPAGLSRDLIDAETHPENFEKLQRQVVTRLLEIDQANSAAGNG